MAVSFISAQTITDADTSVSGSITVPADCTLIVLCATGYGGATTNWFNPSVLSINGSSFTNVVDTDNQTNNGQTWIGRLLNPSTGGQTLSGTISKTPDEGMHYTLVYCKGQDNTTPIKSSGSSGSNNVDITGMTAASGDLMIGCCYDYAANPTVTDSSQTQIRSAQYNTAGQGVAYKASVGAFYYTGSSGYSSACAVVVGAAAASGATGTLAATESGSDTAALAGDVLVEGSLAATESGGDTAALAWAASIPVLTAAGVNDITATGATPKAVLTF